MTASCPAGHQLSGPRRPCAACRREPLIQHVIVAASVPASQAAAAIDAAATSPAVLRALTACQASRSPRAGSASA